MHQIQQRLSAAELVELGRFLAETPNAMPLAKARGFLTAIVSAPDLLMPSSWQPILLGEPEFDSLDHASRIVGLIMRLYNQINSDLNHAQPVRLDGLGDEELRAWCQGYLQGARMDETWLESDSLTLALVPLSILADPDVVYDDASDEEIEDALDEEEPPSPERARAKAREMLPKHLVEIHQASCALRRAQLGRPSLSRKSAKVGRNDPCPCASGKKYKKCCGAPH